MTHPPRLAFLIETVELETQHLLDTDGRLFAQGFDPDRAARLRTNIDESERTDAFVARFGRLQDTVADKLDGDAHDSLCNSLWLGTVNTSSPT